MKNVISTSNTAQIAPATAAAARSASPSPEVNTLYNSQAACLVFSCGIVFKVSSLPGLVYSEMRSDTLWLYLFMIALDLLCLAATFFFASCGADEKLSAQNSPAYRALSAVTSLYLMLKGLVYFVYTVVFLMVDLFVGVPPYVVVFILTLPVIYLGCKGLRGISRCAELLAPVLLFILLANFVFLETELDAGRNLPLKAMPTEEFFSRGLLFGMWLGDCFPMLFASVKKKKAPFLTLGTGISYSLVAVTAMLAVAMYGDALPYVYNMLIRLSGFNKLSLEIGRLEWAAILVVIVMAMLALSLHMWGAAEGCRRATGSPLPARLTFAAAIIVVPLAVPTMQDIIEFSMTGFGYAMSALSLSIAAAYFLSALRARKRRTSPADGENSQTMRDGAPGCGKTHAEENAAPSAPAIHLCGEDAEGGIRE